MCKAEIIGISRIRTGSDGHGITTLVGFQGCPLRCRYCLNPQCWDDGAKCESLTPEEVFNRVKKDELYFLATGGGITFGGGEPLLQSEFIKEVLELGAKQWHTSIETSLNVDLHYLELLQPYIDEYIVDIKDMDPILYFAYTRQKNDKVVSNLKWLAEHELQDKVKIRIPLIPRYNSQIEQQKSREELEKLGFTRFDMFEYNVDESNKKLRKLFEKGTFVTTGIIAN